MIQSSVPRVARVSAMAVSWVFVVASLVLLTSCSDLPRQLELAGSTMGTTYSVKLTRPEGQIDPETLQERIEELLAEVNASMSTYDEHSELSRFNASESTEWTEVSSELASVVSAAIRISEESGGAFDATVGPLVNLWGFGPRGGGESVPSDEAIDAARSRVGFDKLAVRHDLPALKKAIPDLYVDLSAIAKGYGVDRIGGLLEASGVDNYLVEIGGELRGRGLNASGEPWRIAVERPDPEGRSVQAIVSLADAGMATSGDYRNFFEQEGQRFSHTIDPKTGRPVTHALASVTVIHPDAMHADAYATAILVMGEKEGMSFADSGDIAALFILRTTEGFEMRTSAAWLRLDQPSN